MSLQLLGAVNEWFTPAVIHAACRRIFGYAKRVRRSCAAIQRAFAGYGAAVNRELRERLAASNHELSAPRESLAHAA